MEEDRVAKWLYDVRVAIDEIESFMPESGRSISLLQENTMFKRALERNIEIIGEAHSAFERGDCGFAGK
jgi:uncharacterized protein with HEPN domain